MIGCMILLAVLAGLFGWKCISLKRQIRKLSVQVAGLLDGTTEKMLDIALIDRDLERLAAVLNGYFARQRYTVAKALDHEEKLKGSIADISHDLRTPLTVIMGHLQMVQGTSMTAEQRRRVDTALHKAERMKELIGSFYELSVLDAGEGRLQPENINLSNFLSDFLAENAPLFEKREICPRISLPEYSIFIRADRNMLERILQNLLANAVRYTTGEVGITLYQADDGRTVLQMENTVPDGGQIDAGRLFDRFYTGDQARNGTGTGIGLAVVKLLTERLGGEIAAQVEGNCLTVILTV